MKQVLSQQAMLKTEKARKSGLPKSKYYRTALEPYVGKQVQLVFKKWSLRSTENDKIWLALEHGELIYVKDAPGMKREPIKHMLVLTDRAWLDYSKPRHNQGVRVNGFLYEYINQKKQCVNIGLWAMTITPQDVTLSTEQN